MAPKTPTVEGKLDPGDVPQLPRECSELAPFIRGLAALKERYPQLDENAQRGAGYHCQSAHILGLVTSPKVQTAKVTATGRVYAALHAHEQIRRLSYAFEASRCGRAWLEFAGVNDLADIPPKSALPFLEANASGLSPGAKGTMRMRAGALESWLAQFVRARHQTDLSDYHPARQACRLEDLSPTVFEPGLSLRLIAALVQGRSRLDIATGFFTLDGYNLIAEGMDNPDIRILVGGLSEFSSHHLGFLINFIRSLDTGLTPPAEVRRQVIQSIHRKIINQKIRIRTLQGRVTHPLHAKIYLFDGIAAYITSANLTYSGLCTHIEGGQLVTHPKDVAYYSDKFEEYFAAADPVANPILQAMEECWVFQDPISPYLAFLRALFLLYGRIQEPERLPARKLADYQKLIVGHVLGKLAERRSVLLVAPTGTGKTVMATYIAAAMWGRQIRRIVLVSNNPSHEAMWLWELRGMGLDATSITSGQLREKSANPGPTTRKIHHLLENLHDDTLFIVDECHQYRTPGSKGHDNLEQYLLPKDDARRPYSLLLTATPISRGLENLEALLRLTARGEVPALQSVQEAADQPGLITVTLPDILRRFGVSTKTQHRALEFAEGLRFFPNINIALQRYACSMSPVFAELENLDAVLSELDTLVDDLVEDEDDEITGNLKRQANLLKTLLARRAESSPRALARTLERLLGIIGQRKFSSAERRRRSAALQPLLELARAGAGRAKDAKLEHVIGILRDLNSHHKVLIFSEYTDTVDYLLEHLRAAFPRRVIEEITGESSTAERRSKVARIAPLAQGATERPSQRLDVLIATDAISEGENIQDVPTLINYDLPWTPLRLVQRIGRVDRPTEHPREVNAYNLFPEDDRYTSMIRHWSRLAERSVHVNAITEGEILHSGIRDPRSYHGKPRALYFESAATFEELALQVQAEQLPTSTMLQAQLRADPELQRAAENLPRRVYSGKRGRIPGLYLLARLATRFVCLHQSAPSAPPEEIENHRLLRALYAEPDTASIPIPPNMDAMVSCAMEQWSHRLPEGDRASIELHVSVWVVR
jgi:superfamily II DNA or RNA helicase